MTSTNRKGSADKSIPHTRFEDEEMIWETYEKGKKLGQGAFGKVYQVRHKSTDQEWAMKFINKDKAGGSAIKLLEREVSILKKVSHSNIIHLNEVFETAKRMYLVMELCAEGELADALKDRKYFMESEVKLITRELASAIAYLHKNDIVHRDLKLENILVSKFPDATDPEDRLQIKVTDFGLSITKAGVGHDNMMQDFCGTPNYMAPEIIDNKTYSQQCDVWALGVIVYTLFCGYPPFRAKDDDSLYDLIKKGDIDFTDEKWEEVSDEAKKCIQGMLNTDPAHRFTASEVMDSHWITGDSASQQMNVLNLMKQWKDDIKNETEDSAINGEPEDTPDSVSVEVNHTTETNNNETNTTSKEQERPNSGGTTKKPGSGGKSTSRNSTGNIRLSVGNIPQRSSVSPTKNPTPRVSSKSPMPNTKLTSQQPRPNTQNASRNVTPSNNRVNQGSNKNTTATRPSTKGNGTKK